MRASLEDYRKALTLRNEVAGAAHRVNRFIVWGGTLDPEDLVVLRGSTEALIELAESRPSD